LSVFLFFSFAEKGGIFLLFFFFLFLLVQDPSDPNSCIVDVFRYRMFSSVYIQYIYRILYNGH
jgi:hypothetical protein